MPNSPFTPKDFTLPIESFYFTKIKDDEQALEDDKDLQHLHLNNHNHNHSNHHHRQLQQQPEIPYVLNGKPVFRFTRAQNHNQLRDSQKTKIINLTQKIYNAQDLDRWTLNSRPLKSVKKVKSIKTAKYPHDSQNKSNDSSHCAPFQTVFPMKLITEIVFHLSFANVASAPKFMNLKRWSELPPDRMFLFVSTISTKKCNKFVLRTPSHANTPPISSSSSSSSSSLDSNHLPIIYEGRIQDVVHHCIEVENQLELTCKHKGLIAMLKPHQYIVYAGEVFVDSQLHTIFWNNLTGSVRIPMSKNGFHLFVDLHKQQESVWNQWREQTHPHQAQLECPFFNQIVIPSVEYAASERQNSKKCGNKFKSKPTATAQSSPLQLVFDRDLKEKRAPAITLGYLKSVLKSRHDIKYSVTQRRELCKQRPPFSVKMKHL